MNSIINPVKFNEVETDLSHPMYLEINHHLDVYASSSWNWITCQSTEIVPLDEDKNELLMLLDHPDEWIRLGSCGKLAAAGEYELLFERLNIDDIQRKYNAAKGLSLSPPTEQFIEFLLTKIEEGLHQDILMFIISEIVINDLRILEYVKNTEFEDLVSRQYAIEYLHRIGGKLENPDEIIHKLCLSLVNDSDDEVRFRSSLALASFGSKAKKAIPYLIHSITHDHNRYTQSHSLIALRNIPDPLSTDFLLEYLWTSRWCPLTNPLSTW